MRYVMLASVLLLTTFGCAPDATEMVAPPTQARFMMAGPTDSVHVACPKNLVDGQGGECTAHGYDSAGVFTHGNAIWSTPTPWLLSLDDTIGTIWVTANHMVQGTAAVQARIDGVLGDTIIDVSLSSLAASIGGEASVEPNTSCMWWAQVSGGDPSYQYSWWRTGNDDTSQQSFFQTQSSADFTVHLMVTDVRGTQRFDSLFVEVDPGAPVCPSF